MLTISGKKDGQSRMITQVWCIADLGMKSFRYNSDGVAYVIGLWESWFCCLSFCLKSQNLSMVLSEDSLCC